MKEEIKSNLDSPEILEKLFRSNKTVFISTFFELYPEIKDTYAAQFWKFRLEKTAENAIKKNYQEWSLLILLSVIAWVLAKLPSFLTIDETFYYNRNIPFFVFPFITIYFLWTKQIKRQIWVGIFCVYLLDIVFINTFPNWPESNTLLLSIIHQPIFLWFITGFVFVGSTFNRVDQRLNFLRFNGDLVIMSSVLLLAGIVLTAVTIGLFNLINVSIEEFYTEYIVVWGAVGIPIFATHLIYSNPTLVNRVSPVVARVFTPLVTITLFVFILTLLFNEKDPFNDRDFLFVFNGLLIGVMALIFFSIAENNLKTVSKWHTYLLILLSLLTLVINSIALAAIVFRIGEWGVTPNRMAVLGFNLLIFSNVTLVFYHLIRSFRKQGLFSEIENSISIFLPFYGFWSAIVIFFFPFLFSFS